MLGVLKQLGYKMFGFPSNTHEELQIDIEVPRRVDNDLQKLETRRRQRLALAKVKTLEALVRGEQ